MCTWDASLIGRDRQEREKEENAELIGTDFAWSRLWKNREERIAVSGFSTHLFFPPRLDAKYGFHDFLSDEDREGGGRDHAMDY